MRIDDPYRLIEKAERRDELKSWVNASSAHTVAELARLPGRAELMKAVGQASKASDRFLWATVAGSRTFYLKLATDRQVPTLWVRENGKDRPLLDPTTSGNAETPPTIDSYSVSPSGKLIAVNLAENGSEIGTVHFYDVATGRPTGERLARVWGESTVEWLDDQTVFYARIREAKPGEDQLQRQTINLHRLGMDASVDTPLLGTDVPTGFTIAEREVPFVSANLSSRYVLATAGGAQTSVRVGVATVAALRAGKPDWREIAGLDDQVIRETACLVGDTLYYVTTKRDGAGEVRKVALSPSATLAASTPVLSGRGVISASLYTRDGAYAFVGTPFAASRLWYAPAIGSPREIPLPFVGSAFLFNNSADRQTATFAFDGFQQSTSSYRVDHGRLTSLGRDAATLPAARTLKVEKAWATSADGTKVPLTVVSGPERTGPRPTIIEAYGS